MDSLLSVIKHRLNDLEVDVPVSLSWLNGTTDQNSCRKKKTWWNRPKAAINYFLFYPEGCEGSADHILRHDGIGQQGFAKLVIAEAVARHKRRYRPFEIQGSAIAGYGIYATRPITAGEVVFRGEGRSQRVITRAHVEATWSADELETFRHYAYPLADEIFLLWDANPEEWAPQNHSCDPNTTFLGLDVYAKRDIARGQELTLDFAEFLSETSASFACNCGAANCRHTISGTPGNSVTLRERTRRAARESWPR